jgi:hypothetical protein
MLQAFAFIGGMTLQLMPPKAALAADVPPEMGDCPQMAMQPADAGAGHKAPCKGMDRECVKQMGCLGTANLPLSPPSLAAVFSYHKVAYWLPTAIFAARSIKPDLLPPIRL